MYKYRCQVNPADTIVAYETDVETDQPCFALVAENLNHVGKISAVLSKEDAILLRDQLTQFIEGNG